MYDALPTLFAALSVEERQALQNQLTALVSRGLPPMADNPTNSGQTATTNPQRKKHKPAVLIPWEFPVTVSAAQLSQARRSSSIWVTYENIQKIDMPVPLPYGSESDVAAFVKPVLADVVALLKANRLLPKNADLSFQDELSVFGDREDIWVLKNMDVPVGVVKVKRPKDGALDDLKVAGQLYDYMHRLRNFYGLDTVIGIATTYKQWRIFQLAPLVQTASAATSPKLPPDILNLPPSWATEENERYGDESNNESNGESNDESNDDDDDSDGDDDNDDEGGDKNNEVGKKDGRTMQSSKTYESGDPNIVLALASALIKMSEATPNGLDDLLGETRTVIMVSKKSWTWSRPQITKKPSMWPLPSRHVKSFYLLQHLGDGVSGRVWLAMATNGCMCVLKFPRNDAGNVDFANEVNIWTKVWGVEGVRTVILNEKTVLLMPYVKTCDDQLLPEIGGEVYQAALSAVTKLAEEGYCHDDLSWRHVGLYKDHTGGLRALLIDFGKVSAVSSKVAKTKAAAKSKKIVKKMLVRLPTVNPEAAPAT